MKILIHLEDEGIETAAKEEYEELSKELEEENDPEKEEKLEFLETFIETADFKELRKFGFDGSKEMDVEITKQEDGFSISKSWKSMFSD